MASRLHVYRKWKNKTNTRSSLQTRQRVLDECKIPFIILASKNSSIKLLIFPSEQRKILRNKVFSSKQCQMGGFYNVGAPSVNKFEVFIVKYIVTSFSSFLKISRSKRGMGSWQFRHCLKCKNPKMASLPVLLTIIQQTSIVNKINPSLDNSYLRGTQEGTHIQG